MQTQAYFEDIQFHIIKELSKANYSIQITWITLVCCYDKLNYFFNKKD